MATSSVMVAVYRTPLYSRAYVPGNGPSHRLLTYSRFPVGCTRRTNVWALAVVVAVRWTMSRSTGPLSLLPYRVYCPVNGSEGCSRGDIFGTFSSLSKAPFASYGEGLSCFDAKIPAVLRCWFTPVLHSGGRFSTRSDPRMRGNVVDLAGGDGQVYDVDHIAGLWW